MALFSKHRPLNQKSEYVPCPFMNSDARIARRSSKSCSAPEMKI
jgi:hypothetical protein